MIDRYLNDELRQSLSESQKDLIAELMEQPYEERTIDDRREFLEKYNEMLQEKEKAESKDEAEEFTKNGYPERAIHRPNYTPPSSIDRKKRKAKAKAQKQSRRKNRRN